MPDDVPTEQCQQLAGQPHGPHRWHVMEDTRRDCPGLTTANLASDAVAAVWTEPDDTTTVTPPPPDATLFRLRDYTARVTKAAGQPVEVYRVAVEALATFREDAAELASLAQAMDEHLTRGGALPVEWRRSEATPALPSGRDEWFRVEGAPDEHQHRYIGQQFNHTHEGGRVPHGYYEHSEDPGGYVPERDGIGSSCSRACSDGHTYGTGCLLTPGGSRAPQDAPRGGVEYHWRVADHEPTRGPWSEPLAEDDLPPWHEQITNALLHGDKPVTVTINIGPRP